MVTSVNTNSGNSAIGAATPSKPTGQTNADAQQDRFLKLLVAQLNNQDPMNPMDNAQMTSQMAQISTVSGINQLTETMKSMQVMQGANMIGHGVLLKSNTLSVDAGKAKGAIDLAEDADKVSVQILTSGGKLLDTLNLGAMKAGQHSFEWDASKYKDVVNPVFSVSATGNKKTVETTSFAQDTITAVGTSGTSMSLQLKGRAAIAYDAMQAIL